MRLLIGVNEDEEVKVEESIVTRSDCGDVKREGVSSEPE